MANHKSALKRIRQSERRRARNRHVKAGVRTVVKKYQQSLEAGDPTAAATCLRDAERALRKAASKGVIPSRRASRSVGRLAKRLSALQSNS